MVAALRRVAVPPDEPLPVDEQPNERDPVTGALTLINARRGQGLFREDLMQIWDGACAVTNLDCPELLIASHIRPWRASNVKQKLNGYNGLMLCANLDRLFDIGLISFADNGAMSPLPVAQRQASRRAGPSSAAAQSP